MTNENLENVDLEYYDKIGEFLNEFYSLNDFLACPETKIILKEQHKNNFNNVIEPILVDFFNYFKNRQNEIGTNILKKNNSGSDLGEFIGIIYNNLNKKYDLTIFYENPELAKPLLEMDKNNNSTLNNKEK